MTSRIFPFQAGPATDQPPHLSSPPSVSAQLTAPPDMLPMIGDTKLARRFGVERAAGLVEFKLRLKHRGQPGVGLRPGQAQGALRRFHRFGKAPGLREGRGQGVKHNRVLPAGKGAGLAGQRHRFVAVAQGGLRRSGQEPGEIVLE